MSPPAGRRPASGRPPPRTLRRGPGRRGPRGRGAGGQAAPRRRKERRSAPGTCGAGARRAPWRMEERGPAPPGQAADRPSLSGLPAAATTTPTLSIAVPVAPVEAHPQRDVHLHAAARVRDVAEVQQRRPPASRTPSAAGGRGPWRRRGRRTGTSCDRPGPGPGATMTAAVTVFSVLTTRTSGNARWIDSPRLSSLQTPSVGGKPADMSSALATSIKHLARELLGPRGLAAPRARPCPPWR